MKRIKNYIFAAAALLLAVACDKTYVDEVVVGAPLIESFAPEAAPVGSEIVITGQNLSGVTRAMIGDVEMVISEKVSDTRLSIIAGTDGQNGKIKLVNSHGEGQSATDFTYTYAVPELKTALIPASVEMNGNLLLAGNDLSAVNAVLFKADGQSEAHEGQIVEQTASEIVVRVPYVENSTVSISLRYFDGNAFDEVTDAATIQVVRVVPVFDAASFPERIDVGESIKLTGKNLDKVGRILVGGHEASCLKLEESLSFTVPSGDFQDGDTEVQIIAEYFDGHESVILCEKVNVYVPHVLLWKELRTWGQGRDVENFASFFSPETGRVYANSSWQTEVDPIAVLYAGKTSSANNKADGVTQEEYDSAIPYFFFSGVSAGNLQINSPNNSDGQLKNFYNNESSAANNAITGDKNAKWRGTPALMYLFLDPNDVANGSLYSQLAQLVREQKIEYIDEEHFTLNAEAGTMTVNIAGVSGEIPLSGAKGTLASTSWAEGKYTSGTAAENVNIDAVILALHYNWGGAGATNAANVCRLGFVHITKVSFRLWNNTAAPSSSAIDFNCYWQKYDYDYSKI